MLNYVKEDLKLLNMKKVPLEKFSPNSPLVFEIEKELTVEEKIQFIDKQRDGIASYLLNLFEKWEQEKDSLPKDRYSRPKTVSIKAWLRKNDERNIINRNFDLGNYHLFKTHFRSMSAVCPERKHGYNLEYTGKHIAEQWYHDLLYMLKNEERAIFEKSDPYYIKLETVKNFSEKYGNNYGAIFNVQALHDLVWNGNTDIPENHLDKYIQAYQRLEQTLLEIESDLLDELKAVEIE